MCFLSLTLNLINIIFITYLSCSAYINGSHFEKHLLTSCLFEHAHWVTSDFGGKTGDHGDNGGKMIFAYLCHRLDFFLQVKT